jgi:acyl-CoA thioester hydrolase
MSNVIESQNVDKIANVSAPFYWTLRVYYEDTDAGGIVFYANYLKFFERARTEWLRAGGISQQVMTEKHGMMFVVKSTAVDYHSPAKLDDVIELSVITEKLGRASVQFTQQAWRIEGDQRILLATGHIKVGCVDQVSLRPGPIPAEVIRSLQV